MKPTFKSLLVLAAAALAFTGCTGEDAAGPSGKKEKTCEISFSGEKPVLDTGVSPLTAETRTEFVDGTILWSTTGEQISMCYTLDGVFTKKSIYKSTGNAEVSADRKTATFRTNASFNATDEGAYKFYAIYPSDAHGGSGSGISEAPTLPVKISATQSPSATSFDPVADVMLASSAHTYTAIPTGENMVSMRYKRMVAHGILLLNFGTSPHFKYDEGERIKSVRFTVPGKKVAGSVTMDIVAQTVDATGAGDNIMLNYATATHPAGVSPNDDKKFAAWFCSLDFSVPEGGEFTVAVTTDRGIYTRTIKARAGGIHFPQNRYSSLAINMGAEDVAFDPVADADLSGDYVVLAAKSGVYYAMSGTPKAGSTTRLDAPSFPYNGTDSPITVSDETLVWTIAKDESGSYTFDNGGKYIRYSGSSSGTAITTTDPAGAVKFTIAADETEGAYLIRPVGSTEYGLRYNSSNGWFAIYNTVFNPAGSMIEVLRLVPVAPDTRAALDAPTVGTPAVDGKEVAVNWTAVAHAANYTVKCGAETKTAVTGTSATFTMPAYATLYHISVVANPAEGSTDHKPSPDGTATVTTGIDPTPAITPATTAVSPDAGGGNNIEAMMTIGNYATISYEYLEGTSGSTACTWMRGAAYDAGKVTFNVDANPNEARTGRVVVTAINGAFNATATITVNQAGTGVGTPLTVTMVAGNVGGLPTAANTSTTSFTAGGQSWSTYAGYKGTSVNYIMLQGTPKAYIRTPAIAGKTLKSITITTGAGAAATASAEVVDDTDGTTTFSPRQTLDPPGADFTFPLTGSTVNTPYRFLATGNKNTQVVKLVLVYE